MFTLSTQALQALSQWMLWIAAVSSGIAVIAGLVSSVAANSASNALQSEADKRIAEADARGSEALAEAAQANERAAEANQKAEAEKLARLKIERRLAPRTLSGEQLNSIAGKIAPFAPQIFEFVSYQDDAEVKGLVWAIMPALLAGGWKGVPATGMLGFGLIVGVVIEFPPNSAQELEPAANALASVLSAEGIACTAAPCADLDATWANKIRIKVGKKP